jgi:hypothetical protein
MTFVRFYAGLARRGSWEVAVQFALAWLDQFHTRRASPTTWCTTSPLPLLQAWADYLADKGCVAESSGARGEALFVSAESTTTCAAFAKDLAAAEDEMEVGKQVCAAV